MFLYCALSKRSRKIHISDEQIYGFRFYLRRTLSYRLSEPRLNCFQARNPYFTSFWPPPSCEQLDVIRYWPHSSSNVHGRFEFLHIESTRRILNENSRFHIVCTERVRYGHSSFEYIKSKYVICIFANKKLCGFFDFEEKLASCAQFTGFA